MTFKNLSICKTLKTYQNMNSNWTIINLCFHNAQTGQKPWNKQPRGGNPHDLPRHCCGHFRLSITHTELMDKYVSDALTNSVTNTFMNSFYVPLTVVLDSLQKWNNSRTRIISNLLSGDIETNPGPKGKFIIGTYNFMARSLRSLPIWSSTIK
jgi:hypothetical protein